MSEENKVSGPVKLADPHSAAQSPLKLNVVSFISPALGWILSNWKLALFLLMCLVIGVQYELIKHYKAVSASDNTAITILTQSLTDANNALADQNQKILDAKKAADAKQKELDDLAKKIADKDKVDAKKIADLRKKPAGTTCTDALKFMNDYIGTIQWQK